MPSYTAPKPIILRFLFKMLLKRVTLPLTNMPGPKRTNLSMVCNKRWARAPKNKVKHVHFVNVLYCITKL